MEIDITSFFELADPFDFSGSIAERGKNAAKETWANAVAEGKNSPLLTTPKQINALRDHVAGFGAWEDDAIAAWTDAECNALFIQLVSGDMRNAGLDQTDPDWEEYLDGVDAGQYSGNIFRGKDGKIYYYLGD